MKSTTVDIFKETLHKGMLNNFKRSGFLTPIFGYVKKGQPYIIEITQFFQTPEGKILLGRHIKQLCIDPEVECAGLVWEAYAATSTADSEMLKLIRSGNIRVSELKEKQDVIILTFCTPETEELIGYYVDPKNKSIIMKMEGGDKMGGTFSDFFELRKNEKKF